MSESLQKCSKAYWCMLLSVLYFAAPAHGVTASGSNTLPKAGKSSNAYAITIEKPVSGNVVDDKNEPLPGANVVVKGTTIGTTTMLAAIIPYPFLTTQMFLYSLTSAIPHKKFLSAASPL